MTRSDRQLEAAHKRLERKFFPYNKKGGFRPRPNCHGTSVKRTKVPGGECDVSLCPENAVHRIGVNVWGTLVEADVCEQHKDRNGTWTDPL